MDASQLTTQVDVTQLTNHLTGIIAAIGALGTAAFGLLEALKPLCPPINWLGFPRIHRTVAALTPGVPSAAAAPATSGAPPSPAPAEPPLNALPQSGIVNTLKSNWVNGTDLASQKAIAKSLIKLQVSAGNAAQIAAATNVDPNILKDVATNQSKGDALTQPQSDVFSRFDLIVTAILDDCYQRADQFYRNCMRGLAALIAVLLAVTGGWILASATPATAKAFWYFSSQELWLAILVGLLATPLAPIAKDLSTALATAVNTMQLVKKPASK